MRGPFLRNMRVMAGLSASEVAREASLSPSAVRKAEAAGEVKPDIALRYLLAIERYLQRRCSLEKTIGGLVDEARDLVEEEYRAAEGEVVPPRRLPRLSELIGSDKDRMTGDPDGLAKVTSPEEAVLIARRAVRRQRFLQLWRTRLESRAPGRPTGHLGSASLRRLEAREVLLEHQAAQAVDGSRGKRGPQEVLQAGRELLIDAARRTALTLAAEVVGAAGGGAALGAAAPARPGETRVAVRCRVWIGSMRDASLHGMQWAKS